MKLCDVADFADPLLCRLSAEIEGRDGGDSPPDALLERKQWERAMLAGVLTESGRLGPNCSVLAVGAGSEPVVFWLANRAGRVVATDIYGEGKFSGLEATESMLRNPSAFAPVAYPHERLLVRRMDARTLDFADATFQVVYSLSSIEHFGSGAEIARSAAEMGRVLAPGGLAVVVTECLVRRHPLDSAAAEAVVRLATLGRRRAGGTLRQRVALGEAFTLHELIERIVAPSGLRLVQRVDRSISPASWHNLTTVHPGGRLEPATGSVHPHVLVRVSRSVFTSICLVLEKPA